ncbi:MAG: hypothetical protein ACK54I_08555 [Planctomycetota bacterium]|jgi:hypothetical protein
MLLPFSACLLRWANAALLILRVGSLDVPEPLLRELPPGIVVQNSVEVPADRANAIGERLGGQIERLTNSVIQVHGVPLKVNVISCADEAGAGAIYRALAKPYPLSVRKGLMVME